MLSVSFAIRSGKKPAAIVRKYDKMSHVVS